MIAFDSIIRFVVLCGLFCVCTPIIAQHNGNPLLPHIVPLESCLPTDTISAKEKEQLSVLFNDARIIALGEATHGTHEIFTMKHRLIKFLVESKGFKLIGLEAGMPETEIVNRYILSSEGSSSSAHLALRQLGMWSVNNEEVFMLVKWLKEYNAAQRNKNNKVRICGFDIQMTDSAAQIVSRFFRRLNPHYADTFLDTENCYRWLTTNSTATVQTIWQSQEDSVKKQRIDNADSVVRHLDAYRKKYEKGSSREEFAWTQRNAWLISRALRLFSSSKSRDSCMAENVSWLRKFYGQEKIVLWAHNGHIWNEKSFATNGVTAMGWYVRERYKHDYFALALTANTGIYSANLAGRLRRDNEIILDSTARCVENYLHQSGVPQGFINFRTIKESDYFYSWFAARQGLRFIGSVVLPTQFGYTYLLKNFDGLVFIDSTTASRPLPEYHLMR